MSKKAILLTLLSAVAVVSLAAVLSYLVWTNQPSADDVPPVPPEPAEAPSGKPPVPPVPRISGDILDDGIVDPLDINSIIVHWKQVAADYNLIDAESDQSGSIGMLDLNQTIKYWGCLESKGEEACPYLAITAKKPAASSDLPPTPPVPNE